MQRKRAGTFFGLALLAAATGFTDDTADVAAVKAIVTSAYVEGVHRQGDPALMRAGFHPDFRMYMLREGKVSVVTLDQWAERIGGGDKGKGPAPKIDANFTQVDVTGSTAVARVEVRRDGKHVFTDYLSLYKLPEGWRIVAKTFQSH